MFPWFVIGNQLIEINADIGLNDQTLADPPLNQLGKKVTVTHAIIRTAVVPP